MLTRHPLTELNLRSPSAGSSTCSETEKRCGLGGGTRVGTAYARETTHTKLTFFLFATGQASRGGGVAGAPRPMLVADGDTPGPHKHPEPACRAGRRHLSGAVSHRECPRTVREPLCYRVLSPPVFQTRLCFCKIERGFAIAL